MIDASGWLTQQFILLFWPSLVEAEKSDTRFSQPPLYLVLAMWPSSSQWSKSRNLGWTSGYVSTSLKQKWHKRKRATWDLFFLTQTSTWFLQLRQPSWDKLWQLVLCVNLTGTWGARYLVKQYFGVCVWRCFWMRLTFQSINYVK